MKMLGFGVTIWESTGRFIKDMPRDSGEESKWVEYPEVTFTLTMTHSGTIQFSSG